MRGLAGSTVLVVDGGCAGSRAERARDQRLLLSTRQPFLPTANWEEGIQPQPSSVTIPPLSLSLLSLYLSLSLSLSLSHTHTHTQPPLPPPHTASSGCFAVSLTSQQPRLLLEPLDGRGQGVWLPRVFVECVCVLRRHLHSPGLFRKAGSVARQRAMRVHT